METTIMGYIGVSLAQFQVKVASLLRISDLKTCISIFCLGLGGHCRRGGKVKPFCNVFASWMIGQKVFES